MNFAPTASKISETLSQSVSKLLQPTKLGWMAVKLPMKLNCLVIQQMANTVFAEQIAEGDFEFLESRLLQVEILDANIFVGLSYNQNRISCVHFDDSGIVSDVTLSIDTENAIKLIRQEIDPDTLFFQRKLKINGDTELAHHVKNTIDTLDPEIIPDLLMKLITEYEQRVLND